MGKFLGLGTLFIIGVCLADLVTHSTGTQALGTASDNLLKTGSSALLGVAPGNG